MMTRLGLSLSILLLILASCCPVKATQVNVALYKSVNQSGTLEYPEKSGKLWRAETAVDGHKSCTTASNKFYSSTALQTEPWWQLDLERVFDISRVVIYGKQNPFHRDQYDGFRLYITTNGITSGAVNHAVNIDSSNYEFDQIPGPFQGRFVTIRLQPLSTNTLVLCEVEVYVTAINIAPRAILTASDMLVYENSDYKKGNAVDGHDGSPVACHCCYSSVDMVNPYFSAVFKESYEVRRIDIKGRNDNRENSLLSYATVFLDGKKVITKINDARNRLEVNPDTPVINNITILREKPAGTSSDWYLMICEIWVYVADYNLLPRIQATTSGSSAWNNYESNLAIDGRVPGNMSYKSCNCCSVSITGWTWWQLDLKDLYLIGAFEIIGRSDHPDQYLKATVSVSNISSDVQLRKTMFNISGGYYTFYQFNQRSTFRFLRISRFEEFPLSICEVRVFKSECAPGAFGRVCEDRCHCYNNAKCSDRSGLCPSFDHVCATGWKGPSCNKPCTHATFGPDCKGRCHCFNNANCSRQNGSCPPHDPLCAPGWQGLACDKECGYRTFGPDCKNKCHCSNNRTCSSLDGSCPISVPLCDSGWQGSSCSKACTHGNFGPDCKGHCHCNNNATCSRQNGSCPLHDPLCAPGWRGNACDKECGYRTFGPDCKKYCHCTNNKTCSPRDGMCPTHVSLCDSGWQVTSCSKECGHGQFGPDCKKHCHCYNNTGCPVTTGLCPINNPLCEPGWQGESCDLGCEHGKFGLNCSITCHCYANASCTNDNGVCPEAQHHCAAGWHGLSCDKACAHGSFGYDCTNRCHCNNNASCSEQNGSCLLQYPLCSPGWQGLMCSEGVISDQVGSSSKLVGPIVGGSVAVTVCLAVISILLIMIFRRLQTQRRETKDTSNTDNLYTQPNRHLTPTELSVYDTLETDRNLNIGTVDISHDYVNEQIESVVAR